MLNSLHSTGPRCGPDLEEDLCYLVIQVTTNTDEPANSLDLPWLTADVAAGWDLSELTNSFWCFLGLTTYILCHVYVLNTKSVDLLLETSSKVPSKSKEKVLCC